jgi:hypothetical protein
VIHGFIHGGIKLIAVGVSGLVGDAIQSASEAFCAQAPLISRWRWMGTERHNAHLFVVAQIAAE